MEEPGLERTAFGELLWSSVSFYLDLWSSGKDSRDTCGF